MPQIWSGLPEVLQYQCPMICPRLDIASHGRRNVVPGKVLPPPQHEAVRHPAIPPSPAGFLIVRFERRWWPPIEDLPDVGLVDAHPEGAGRDDDVHLIREEHPQHPPADAGAEAGMVGCSPHTRAQQRARDEFRQPPGGCVNERRTGSIPNALPDRSEPLAIVTHTADAELEIGTIKRRDDDL